MVIIDSNTWQIAIPKVDRCKSVCGNLYQIVLQHKSTREVIVFLVRDFAANSPAYYLFKFEAPGFMAFGEYDLYLVSNDGWGYSEIDIAAPKQTTITPTKWPVMYDGAAVVCGGYLLMTNKSKALVTFDNVPLKSNGDYVLGAIETCDQRATGDMYYDIDVIHTDLLKYREPEGYKCEGHNLRDVTYKEYTR